MIKDHPVSVLSYACKSHYDDIAKEAAPLTLDLDSNIVSKLLGPNHMLRWVRHVLLVWYYHIHGICLLVQFQYRERYLENIRLMYNYVPPFVGLHKGGIKDCGLWAPFELAVLRRLLKLTSLVGADAAGSTIIHEEMEPLRDCTHCMRRADKWATSTSLNQQDVSWTSF